MNKMVQKNSTSVNKTGNNKITNQAFSPNLNTNNNPNEVLNRNSLGMQKLFSKMKNPNQNSNK